MGTARAAKTTSIGKVDDVPLGEGIGSIYVGALDPASLRRPSRLPIGMEVQYRPGLFYVLDA